MSFFNERDLGKHNNATTGFAALAKKTNPKIAGKQLAHMREKGQVEEGGWNPVDEPVAKASAAKSPVKSMIDKIGDKLAEPRFPVSLGQTPPYAPPGSVVGKRSSSKQPDPNVPGSMIVVGPDTGPPPKKTDDNRLYKDSVPVDEPVKKTTNEADRPMTAKQKSFAKLAPPADKITFADKIAGAKKEVDEMLGNVAADAMKKAIGSGRGRNAEMDEASDWSQLHKPFKAGDFDDTPTRRRSSSGGEIDTSKAGSTIHRPVKGNYSGAAHSGEERRANQQADAADERAARAARAGRRPVGAGNGTKIGAKINRGTSKLMTREGDQDPADQGEYDREGEMGRNEIHTMMRNAKQLEKMLGNDDDLPEWVQKKLSLASDYMQTIADYLASEKETDAEDQTGREVEVELAEKKAPGKKAKAAKPDFIDADGDGDKTEPMKKAVADKKKKPFAKKEEEVEESTTSGSVATASTSGKASKGGFTFGKASKGGMSFGKGIYDSIDRAVERQINESMNISMNMSNDEHGGPRQTLTITATDEDASQLATLLKMAGMGVSTADGDYTALMPHSGEEVCSGCGMSSCGCGDMEQMDETYGDNVTDMNSPDYPTNTERAQDNFGYSGGINKPKRDVAGNGQSTVPVTAVRGQDDDFQESIQRMREIAGIKPVSEDKAEWLKPEGMAGSEPTAPGGVVKKKEGNSYVYAPKVKDERLTATIPSRYVNLDKKDQKYIDPDKRDSENKDSENKDSENSTNESIFTDTANLWKSYKG